MFELALQFDFADAEKASAVLAAIVPELNAKHAKRSSVSVNIKKSIMLVNIKASDKTALRAATNSCLNSVILAKNILEVN